jgi:CelD/BcsL family acetyltransferase involved in cellulose biosynthesis
LGSGEVCSDYIRILSREGLEKDVSIAVVEYLTDFCKRHSATQSTRISIEGVEADAPWLREFCEVTESRGYRHWLQPIMSSFRLTLPRSMNEYISTLGDSAKRKGKRLLSKLRSGQVTWHGTDEASEIPARLAELRRLHQARRVMLGQTGCFSDRCFDDFLSEAVELLAQRNLVRIDRCEVDGKTIATDLVLKGTDTVFMYQSGIDPDAMKLEPGHLLTVGSIQNAIESGVTYYDTLRGDEKYKTYWGSSAVPLATLHCRPPYLLSQVAGFSHFRFWQLKQVAKRFLGSKQSSK